MSKTKIWVSIIAMSLITILYLRTLTLDKAWEIRYSSDEQYSISCYRYKYALNFKHFGYYGVKLTLYDRIKKKEIYTKRLKDLDDCKCIKLTKAKLMSGKCSTTEDIEFKLPRPLKLKKGDSYHNIKSELE